MLKIVGLSMISLATAFAVNAETTGTTAGVQSEYFYQTDADKVQANANLGYTSQTAKTGATKNETTKTILNLNYERGLNEMISVGGTIGYVTGKSDTVLTTDADTKGLDDVKLFVKGQNSFAAGSSLNYGATFNASLGKKEIKTDSESVNSGGMGLTPYVGYQMLMGSMVLGTKLQTALNVGKAKWEDSSNTPTTSYDVTGGNRSMLSVFTEGNVGTGLIGGELGWWGDNTLKVESSSGGGEVAGETGYSLTGYTRWDLTPQATLIGKLSYESALSDHTGIDSSDTFGMNIGGRFTF